MLFPLVAARVAACGRAALEAALTAKGGCFGFYGSMTEAANEPVLVTENPMFGRTDNPSGLDYAAPGPFATLPSAERGAPQRAPRLGEHTSEVLSNLLHLGDAEIDALAADGVVALG